MSCHILYFAVRTFAVFPPTDIKNTRTLYVQWPWTAEGDKCFARAHAINENLTLSFVYKVLFLMTFVECSLCLKFKGRGVVCIAPTLQKIHTHRLFSMWSLVELIEREAVAAVPGGKEITVVSRFATIRFTSIHFYDPCWIGPSTPDLWCITITTQASFLYLVHF
jgi:hypothetical protein